MPAPSPSSFEYATPGMNEDVGPLQKEWNSIFSVKHFDADELAFVEA
jgi:hypothetical protein